MQYLNESTATVSRFYPSQVFVDKALLPSLARKCYTRMD
jgi:hypothetical protein